MPLERYKTQVLLLHSQQSTLDQLGAGVSVNEKYAVHYATSGTEALNTLGETPIHVIVSAQDLPGMSGLEALREAKKRSPDTIGILLAGSDRDDGLEALVGDKEVFQIVRGAISPEALLNIIETATKRVRMLAISESANDTAANVDWGSPESSGEHIIMETAENGATIISDGTGRMPALRPERIQASAGSGGREVDLLVLTKDQEFLKTIKDSARGLHNVHHAHTAGEAQEIARTHKVGVLVTDAALAGSKIQALTQALRRDVPRLVAVVAGRRDDGELLMDLINRGQVYRFLLKPVSPGRARLAIEASVKHHLEAPDATFKGQGAGGRSAPAPAAAKPAPATRAAPRKPAPEPARKPAPKPAPRPAPRAAAKPAPKPASKPREDLSRTGRRRTPVIKPIAPEAPPAPVPQPESPSFRDDSLGGESSSKRPLMAAAAVVVLAAAGGFWFFGGSAPEEAAPPATAAETKAPEEPETSPAVSESAPRPAVTETDLSQRPAPARAAPQEPPPDPAYASLLEDARLARDAGRILGPRGDNAVELYLAAREAAPDNEIIAEELAALSEQLLAMAETALLENRAADAGAALDRIAMADPDHPRLGFLNAQLEQIELRMALDESRLAIREERFEDAAGLLERARAIGGADAAELDMLAEDLATARAAQQTGDVLALAAAQLAEDRLIEPSNDNARYYFRLALSNDPGNAQAEQGLVVVASKLVLKARDAIDAGELERAATLLGEASALDSESGDLEAATAALQGARERQAEAAAARSEAARQAEAERRAAIERREAVSATLSNAPETAPASFVGGGAAEFAGGNPEAAADAGSAAPEGADAAGPTGGAAGQGATTLDTGSPFVAISDLTRVNYVAPDYPRAAQRRNISGWAEVSFTVTADGTVDAIEIMDSMPGSMFDDAATTAVSQWRFEPVVENGVPVPKRAAVRLAFTLE